MKTLVTYFSQTGNTKKVARAIYETLSSEKEIMDINRVGNLDYDLVFFGCPIQPPYPPGNIKKHLGRLTGKTALFITHGSPENEPELKNWIIKYQACVPGKIVGTFDCQGPLSLFVKLFMYIAPDPKLRKAARNDNSKGQPDAARLKKAAEWAVKIIKDV